MPSPCKKMSVCTEKFGNKVDGSIGGFFSRIGTWVGTKPRWTIVLSFAVCGLCCIGFLNFTTENRPEELWVPQGTTAEQEEEQYLTYFDSTSRFNNMIVQSSNGGGNVLTKQLLETAMEMHAEMETRISTTEGVDYDLVDLCTKAGGSCASGSSEGVCRCLLTSILKQWDYDLATLRNDTDVLASINNYGTRQDLEAILGKPTFDDSDRVVSAEAFTISYFLQDRAVIQDGNEEDPINEAWEKDVFLSVAQSVPQEYAALKVDYFAGRSFSDEFGDAISGDLLLVQVSYAVVFVFLGATLGKIKCGEGSRWTMALSTLCMIVLATGAGFGLSSAFGLFFGPVHSLLPFVLLGIGVDDAFVIVNAFDRERKVPRSQEDNDGLMVRCAKSLSRAGASITVTSLTDLVAFAISASSALPALASFCAYASISIFFLWLFATTFFTATMVFDERRQRDNRRECLCCLTRKGKAERQHVDDEEQGGGSEENWLSTFFRKYFSPAILSKPGKVIVLLVFGGLLGFGIYGTINLSVEDTSRNFVPSDSYLNDYLEAADEYFPDQGIDLYITFEGSPDIYSTRQGLSELDERLTGLSTAPPYISEPVSEEAYRNVMDGFKAYLDESGTDAIGGAPLGDDGWPTTEADFVSTLARYASFAGPGNVYAQDVSFSEDGSSLDAFRVKLEYVRLTKTRGGEVIDDSDKQIEAMDATRDMVESWDDLAPAFPYSAQFIAIEGFKIIQRELFQNVGLAILAVGIIVFITVASPVTALLITLNVAACICEILGFMYAVGIAIDSVSVINLVLAVGLSVDYSAHVGHCFMVKGGNDKNARVTETLADIGAAVLNGAITTFLAVFVLLFSSSYVFEVLSRQFALTVLLGVLHGLVLLPVLLSLIGPRPFSSAEKPEEFVMAKSLGESANQDGDGASDENLEKTGHQSADSSSEDDVENQQIDNQIASSSSEEDVESQQLDMGEPVNIATWEA